MIFMNFIVLFSAFIESVRNTSLMIFTQPPHPCGVVQAAEAMLLRAPLSPMCGRAAGRRSVSENPALFSEFVVRRIVLFLRRHPWRLVPAKPSYGLS